MRVFSMSQALGFILTAVTSMSVEAYAFPESQGIPKSLTALDDEEFTADFDFKGIIALSNCSGSLIRFETDTDDQQAFVLTNGHCIQMIPAGTIRSNELSSRRFTVLGATGNQIGTVNGTELVYATMTKTDIGIYQVRETYAEIRQRFGVEALTLSSTGAEVGDPIEVISGYWQRGYRCSIEALVPRLREGEWDFTQSLRYSRPGCQVIGGTSGSPVILAGSRTVIAINNTGNMNGQACTLNNPCEMDEDGQVTRYVRGYSYAQQTAWIPACFNASRQLDLSLEGCELPNDQ